MPNLPKCCAECNITFIGPSSEVISQMGDKAEARKQMIAANVPVIPGSDDVVATVEEGIELAKRIGFPLLIKAVAGEVAVKGFVVLKQLKNLNINL